MMMPVVGAKTDTAKLARGRVKVGFILLPGFTMFSYSALVYILKHCTDPAAAVGVDFEYIVLGQKPAQTTCGVQVPPTAPLHAARDCNYVFVIGGKTAAPVEDRRSILEALTNADLNSATLIGTGSGLFVLIDAAPQRPNRVVWSEATDHVRRRLRDMLATPTTTPVHLMDAALAGRLWFRCAPVTPALPQRGAA